MMIGDYPYLMNPSGMGGVYAAAVASQPVDPVAAIQGQTNSPFIQFGGTLSGAQAQSAPAGGQAASNAYTPGSMFDIVA
jgi:hypothetical protein